MGHRDPGRQITAIFYLIAGTSRRLMALQVDVDAAIATGFTRHTSTTTGTAIDGITWL
jgi:hypothetical protein